MALNARPMPRCLAPASTLLQTRLKFVHTGAVVRAVSEAVNTTYDGPEGGERHMSSLKRSRAIRVCLQPPVLGEVADLVSTNTLPWEATTRDPPLVLYHHGTEIDVDFLNGSAVLSRWRGFTDDCAFGIATYTITLERLTGEAVVNGSLERLWQPLNQVAQSVFSRNAGVRWRVRQALPN